MINKRLIGTVSESKKYIAGNVAAQWCSLVANIAIMTAVTGLLASLFYKTADKQWAYNCSYSSGSSYDPFFLHTPFKPYGISLVKDGKKNTS